MIEGLKPYAEYKVSGQKWLGGVPAHWELKPGHAAFAKRKEPNLRMKEKTVQDNESFRHWLTDTVFGMTYGD